MTRDEHLFLKLMEECAEVQQRVSKLLQFGMNEIEPGQSVTNSYRLRAEINDLLCVIQMLEQGGNIPVPHNDEMVLHFAAKRKKIAQYLRYSEVMGRVDLPE